MNHDDEITCLAIAYADLIHSFILEINAIKDTKHKVEKKQELDLMDHYFRKAGSIITELNIWLTAFGVDGNAKNA